YTCISSERYRALSWVTRSRNPVTLETAMSNVFMGTPRPFRKSFKRASPCLSSVPLYSGFPLDTQIAEVDCAHCGAKFTMKRAWQSFLAMLAVLQTGMNETQGNRLCQSNTDYRRGEFTTMRKSRKICSVLLLQK